MALFLGPVGLPSFSVTFFVPSAAESAFGISTVSSSLIISSGYLAAIFVNLGVGYLMDRFNKWRVMGVLMTAMVVASLGMTAHTRICTVMLLAFGFAATNQGYGLAADVLRGRESGNVMGVVSLGAGVFGYIGPQVLGSLRDWTGGFSIGWYVIAGICLGNGCGVVSAQRPHQERNRNQHLTETQALGFRRAFEPPEFDLGCWPYDVPVINAARNAAISSLPLALFIDCSPISGRLLGRKRVDTQLSD